MAEENKLKVYPLGITEKEIKQIADEAIEESGAANEVPMATIEDAGKVIVVGDDGKYELGEAAGGNPTFYIDKDINFAGNETIQDILDVVGTLASGTKAFVVFKSVGGGIFNSSFVSFYKNLFSIKNSVLSFLCREKQTNKNK